MDDSLEDVLWELENDPLRKRMDRESLERWCEEQTRGLLSPGDADESKYSVFYDVIEDQRGLVVRLYEFHVYKPYNLGIPEDHVIVPASTRGASDVESV